MTSEVLPCGSVAVAVMTGSPAGAVKGTANATCPLASVVTSSDPRKSWASPGAAGTVAGAGEDIDAERRVGLAAPEPAFELAAGGRDDDREVLEVVGSLARCGAIVRHPVVAEVDGLSRVGEDAVGRDLVADGEVVSSLTHDDPGPPLSVIRLPATAVVPPIVLPELASISTPFSALPSATAPAASVPIWFPAITLLIRLGQILTAVVSRSPEITFPSSPAPSRRPG